MKQNKYYHRLFLHFLMGFLVCFITAVSSSASVPWRTRADLDISAPGLVETVLPAGLVSARDGDAYDLLLTGPDGKPRAFELYWRDPVDRVRHTLTPENVRLTEKQRFIWEADIPVGLEVDRLEIQLAESQYIGRMNVEGLLPDGWVLLAADAAVYRSDEKPNTVITVDPGRYEKIRLSMTGYDKSADSALSVIRSVVVGGQHTGKDFAKESLPVGFESVGKADHLDLEVSLPGSGLHIDALVVRTQAGFIGEWQVGRYLITEGQKRFSPLIEGNVPYVNERPQELRIDVARRWQERGLVLRLHHGDRYIGEITDVIAQVRLPRLVFAADVPGRYIAYTGAEKRVQVFAHSGRPDRKADQLSLFGPVETNSQWRIETLVEKYQIKGGPFDPDGFAWRSLIPVSHPGYYRFQLHLSAALEVNAKGVRLVRDGMQVPFFFGPDEIRQIGLETDSQYDAKSNRTIWTVRFPRSSPQWRYIELKAAGIFKREVTLALPDAVGPNRQTVHRTIWEHRGEGAGILRLPLNGAARDQLAVEIAMNHGDNQPLEIDEIDGYFRAQTLYFLAHSAGDYELFGGHPTIAAPRYDLSLVQPDLMAALPDRVDMGDPLPIGTNGWPHRIVNYFKETNFGLYAVLGVVTLVLIGIVVRLLPKPIEEGDDNASK